MGGCGDVYELWVDKVGCVPKRQYHLVLVRDALHTWLTSCQSATSPLALGLVLRNGKGGRERVLESWYVGE